MNYYTIQIHCIISLHLSLFQNHKTYFIVIDDFLAVKQMLILVSKGRFPFFELLYKLKFSMLLLYSYACTQYDHSYLTVDESSVIIHCLHPLKAFPLSLNPPSWHEAGLSADTATIDPFSTNGLPRS